MPCVRESKEALRIHDAGTKGQPMIERLLIKPVLYVLVAIALAGVLFGGVQCSKRQTAEVAQAKAEKETADLRAAIAEEREQFTTWARDQETRHRDSMAKLDQDNQKRIADAQAATDRLVAGLRDDTVRLHARWQAALATSRLSAGAAAASGTHDPAGDVEASVGRIIGAARACDAQVIGLQQAVRNIVATCNAKPPERKP